MEYLNPDQKDTLRRAIAFKNCDSLKSLVLSLIFYLPSHEIDETSAQFLKQERFYKESSTDGVDWTDSAFDDYIYPSWKLLCETLGVNPETGNTII